MYFIIFGIFPILISAQVLVTDLVDAVNPDGRLIKYLEKDSVPYTGKVFNYYNNGIKELKGNYNRGLKEGKWVGEFKKEKIWNAKLYDKDGNVIKEYVEGEIKQ